MEDYGSDEEFANFRMVKTGSIPAGVLYRSCSPIDDRQGRSDICDKLCKTAGINTFLNLCNDDRILSWYLWNNPFSYYGSKKVINGDFHLNFQDDFQKKKLGILLKELSVSEPPFFDSLRRRKRI